MGIHFDALDTQPREAILWKAKQNLSMTLASGNSPAQNSQQKFLDNNCESIAANAEGLKHVLQEYKENLILEDD